MPRQKGAGHKTGRKDSLGRAIYNWVKGSNRANSGKVNGDTSTVMQEVYDFSDYQEPQKGDKLNFGIHRETLFQNIGNQKNVDGIREDLMKRANYRDRGHVSRHCTREQLNEIILEMDRKGEIKTGDISKAGVNEYDMFNRKSEYFMSPDFKEKVMNRWLQENPNPHYKNPRVAKRHQRALTNTTKWENLSDAAISVVGDQYHMNSYQKTKHHEALVQLIEESNRNGNSQKLMDRLSHEYIDLYPTARGKKDVYQMPKEIQKKFIITLMRESGMSSNQFSKLQDPEAYKRNNPFI